MKNLSFKERLELFRQREGYHDYPLWEFLDDCQRVRSRKNPKPGYSTSLEWHHDKNILALFKYHLDEFEAWLKLQL
jgi:hypothetical protein